MLFELGTEELPPASLQFFWRSLRDGAVLGLKTAGLVDSDLNPDDLPELYAARRLALAIPGVRSETKSNTEVRRGPALKAAFDERGRPTKALLGFARGCEAGEEQIERWRIGEDCERTEKGAWLQFTRTVLPRPVQEIVPQIFGQAVTEMPLDVRMRWGVGQEEFARPVRWVVLLYGGQVVPGDLMGLEFGRESRGHRFLGSGLVAIEDAESYRDRLREHSVLAARSDRSGVLAGQIQHIEQRLHQEGGEEVAVVQRAVSQEKSLSSAEWPQAVAGNFDERFLELPEEVVEAVLEDQQQCFPVRKPDWTGAGPYLHRVGNHPIVAGSTPIVRGRLAPYFVTVANLPDKEDRIRTGCERVVQARLQDAEFYWQRDRQSRLEDRVTDLDRVVFHRKLGTLADRTRRIETLAGPIAEMIGTDKVATVRAAHLCKADLCTDMVQAFPNLQGVMGGHYARADGENEAVCIAIAEHYWHRPLPREEVSPFELSGPGLALALADRLDMLVGIFAVGDTPTGTSDPLGVRRAAYDVVHLTLSHDVEQVPNMSGIDVSNLLERSAESYPESLGARKVVSLVQDYLADRLRSIAVDGNHARDEVEAVLAIPWGNPVSVFQRLRAMEHLRNTVGVALAEANKRIRNILRKSEAPDGGLDPELLREPAEQALAERVAALRPKVEELCQERQYEQAMEQLSTLAEPVAQFFDDVLVMAEEPELRHNRLRLLRDVRALFLTIADLSRLQGAPKAA